MHISDIGSLANQRRGPWDLLPVLLRGLKGAPGCGQAPFSGFHVSMDWRKPQRWAQAPFSGFCVSMDWRKPQRWGQTPFSGFQVSSRQAAQDPFPLPEAR